MPLSEEQQSRIATEEILSLKRFLKEELNLRLEKIPGVRGNAYQLKNRSFIVIQYSKYHPKQRHNWFGISKSKLERLQPEKTFFLLVCGKENVGSPSDVYVFPALYLKELFKGIPTVPSGDKWEFNILETHRLRVYGKKEQKENISSYLRNFDFILKSLDEDFNRDYSTNARSKFHLPEELSEESYWEGAAIKVTINRYERDSSARRACLQIHGFNCAVCNFNFEQVYGGIGKEYIHVHHIRPLSEIKSGYEANPGIDLVPVCPNCHAMLHARSKPFSIDELKEIVINKSNRG